MKLLSHVCINVRNRAKEKRTSINHHHKRLVRSAFCQFWPHFSKSETISTLVIYVSSCFSTYFNSQNIFFIFIFIFFCLSSGAVISRREGKWIWAWMWWKHFKGLCKQWGHGWLRTWIQKEVTLSFVATPQCISGKPSVSTSLHIINRP